MLLHSQQKQIGLCQGHTETGEGCSCCQWVHARAKGLHGKERKTDFQRISLERMLSCRFECSTSGQRVYQPSPTHCHDATLPYEMQTNCTTHRKWHGPGEFCRNDFADDADCVLASTAQAWA